MHLTFQCKTDLDSSICTLKKKPKVNYVNIYLFLVICYQYSTYLSWFWNPFKKCLYAFSLSTWVKELVFSKYKVMKTSGAKETMFCSPHPVGSFNKSPKLFTVLPITSPALVVLIKIILKWQKKRLLKKFHLCIS